MHPQHPYPEQQPSVVYLPAPQQPTNEVPGAQAWVNMVLIVLLVTNLLLTGYVFLFVHELVDRL